MTLQDIANIRLQNQQIAGTKLKTAKELVGWMGAIQAQDYAMSKWAIGVRLPHFSHQSIESQIDKGEIIRTHILRPTWHLVSADDIYWMLDLTAPRLKGFAKSWNKSVGLTDAVLNKSKSIIEKALEGGKHLTRDEITVVLNKAKINTDSLRSLHLFLSAELDGIICNGPNKGNKQTYALLSERVPKIKRYSKEESLAKLANQYFLSHSPATIKDFTWWSGLAPSDARIAVELIKSDLIKDTIGEETYYLTNSLSIPKNDNPSVYLLPAFDEFLISYKDRQASLPIKNNLKAVSTNGIFRPVIVINGQVTGLWKRSIKKDKVILETSYFHPHNKSIKNLIEKAAYSFGSFLNKKAEIYHK